MGKHSSHQQIYPIMAIRLMIIPDLRKGETTKSPRKAAGASAILLKSMGHGQRESSGWSQFWGIKTAVVVAVGG